jgi:hypothetical protein
VFHTRRLGLARRRQGTSHLLGRQPGGGALICHLFNNRYCLGNTMQSIRIDWTAMALVISAAIGVPASAQVIKVVTPASAQNTEGISFATPAASPIRIQHLILASDFANLPTSHRQLVGFNFRADTSQVQSLNWGSGAERIWMSTTTRNNLTTVFEQNHGSNKALVHDGPMFYPLLATGPAGGPKDIAGAPLLQTPFFYDPSQGNLLVDRLVFSTNPSPRANIDTLLTNQNVILLNNTDPLNATSGTFTTAPAVLQFEFVPETSALALAVVALVSVAAWSQKRRRLRAS